MQVTPVQTVIEPLKISSYLKKKCQRELLKKVNLLKKPRKSKLYL